MKYLFRILIITVPLFIYCCAGAQPLNKKKGFTHQDTLRGSLNAERNWWNVTTYSIDVTPDYSSKTITGTVEIGFAVNTYGKNKVMQIDLQQPLSIDSIIFNNNKITNYRREENVYHVEFGDYKFFVPRTLVKTDKPIQQHTIKIFYHGSPRVAMNPPWDGGWIFAKDAKGRPWMTVACQGLGASVWYPCKDHQSDEPDFGATLSVTVVDSLTSAANGRLADKKANNNGTTTWKWEVKNPINNYDIIPYIGKYVNYTDTLMGEKGKLDLSYWVLDYNLEKAKAQFGRDVKRMLRAFEYWFGPYPFYEDGYKLIESSHLGMEHQSGVAYGNKYRDGYLGRDLSGSGWGLKWDYIIVHESGHEWFGNNITTNDIADMWVHEGFTMYSEALFIEYYYGKKAADEYVQGLRRSISNDIPLIGPYGVNHEGSSDMYNKGANLMNTIREIIGNDELFRKILRGLNSEFYHKTTTSKAVEAYISKESGKDFSKVFDQYLRTTNIPALEYKIDAGDNLSYRWTNCVKGFNMPVNIEKIGWLKPTANWQSLLLPPGNVEQIKVLPNFYVNVKKSE